jgi:hypothetical protein
MPSSCRIRSEVETCAAVLRHITEQFSGKMRATSRDDVVICHLLRGGSGNYCSTPGSYPPVLITPDRNSIKSILEHALHKESLPPIPDKRDGMAEAR